MTPERQGPMGRLSGPGFERFCCRSTRAAHTHSPPPVTETRVVLSGFSVCACRVRSRSPPRTPLLSASDLGPEPQGEHPLVHYAGPVSNRLELCVALTPGDIVELVFRFSRLRVEKRRCAAGLPLLGSLSLLRGKVATLHGFPMDSVVWF